MESRTERLLRAVGNREAFAIVRELLGAEMTTNSLSRATHLTTSTLEPALETLSQAGLVSRHPGPQGAWFIAQWQETFAVLNAARVLGVALQGSEDHSAEAERSLFAQLEDAGGPSAAAKRGRPRAEEDP